MAICIFFCVISCLVVITSDETCCSTNKSDKLLPDALLSQPVDPDGPNISIYSAIRSTKRQFIRKFCHIFDIPIKPVKIKFPLEDLASIEAMEDITINFAVGGHYSENFVEGGHY